MAVIELDFTVQVILFRNGDYDYRYTEQGNPVASPAENNVLYSARVCIVLTQTRHGFTANGHQIEPPEFDGFYDYGFTESGHPVDSPVSDVLGDLGFAGDP